VQDRLAGTVVAADGAPVPGPQVRWIGRRHGRRTDRRWATSWSPEQIANRLAVDFPDDESMRISHEAIYQALYVQGRGALRRELTACLRTGRALRVPRARARARGDPRRTPPAPGVRLLSANDGAAQGGAGSARPIGLTWPGPSWMTDVAEFRGCAVGPSAGCAYSPTRCAEVEGRSRGERAL
jgi:hypothetical protein